MVKEMDIPSYKHLGTMVIGQYTIYNHRGEICEHGKFQGKMVSLTMWTGGCVFQLRDRMPAIKVDFEKDDLELRIVEG